MLIKFAYRNVFRNKRRSFLTGLAIFFAAVVGIFSQGYINGAIGNIIGTAIKYQSGNIRITTENFLKREKFLPVDEIIDNSKELKDKIGKIKGVSAVEERIKFGIMLGKDDNSVSAMGIGIDLKRSKIDIEGKLLKGNISKNGIFIGDLLAKKIGAKVGDKLLLATKTSEGGLNGIKLKVKGIISFGITMFDENVFFIDLANARKLLKMKDGVTELYIFTKTIKITEKVEERIKKIIPSGTIARNFKAQLGSLYETIRVEFYIFYFIEALILFLASFVVINTIMKSIFERLPEIGTLKALGMTDKEIYLNFIYEGGIIGGCGGILGSIAGYLIVIWVGKVGMNFQEIMSGIDMPIEYIIRPKANYLMLIISILLSIIIPALSSMIPARYAQKLEPAEALRKI